MCLLMSLTCLRVSGDCFLAKWRTASTFSSFFPISWWSFKSLCSVFERVYEQRMVNKKRKRLDFFWERKKKLTMIVYVCVPQALCSTFASLSLHLYIERREKKERLCCVMERFLPKTYISRRSLLAADAVMSFCGRSCVKSENRWPPLTVSNAVKWLRLCKLTFFKFSSLGLGL